MLLAAPIAEPVRAAPSCYHDVTRSYVWDYGTYQYGSYAVKTILNPCADVHLKYSSITDLHKGQHYFGGTWIDSGLGPRFIWAGTRSPPPPLIGSVAAGTSIRIAAVRYAVGRWQF